MGADDLDGADPDDDREDDREEDLPRPEPRDLRGEFDEEGEGDFVAGMFVCLSWVRMRGERPSASASVRESLNSRFPAGRGLRVA